jgi:hypothetical protein
MNKDLKAAIENGMSAKQKEQHAREKAEQKASKQRQIHIKSQLPKARKWIEKVLFAEIAKIEAELTSDYQRSIYLGDGRDGISAEAIYMAAKEVDGLIPFIDHGAIYENAEYQGPGEPSYYIKWKSIDSKDNDKETDQA